MTRALLIVAAVVAGVIVASNVVGVAVIGRKP